MIHPESSYIVECERHLYGPTSLRVEDDIVVRVGDKAGTWCGLYRYGGLFTLVGFVWGVPPAVLAVPFSTRGEVLRYC